MRARFNANAFSGRVEGGYRFVTAWMGLTPYAAGQSRRSMRTSSSLRPDLVFDTRRPFLRGSCRLFSTFPVSGDNYGLSGGFLASGLCIQKFRSWQLDFEGLKNMRFRKPLLCRL
jgi:hypothetical protein